MICRSFPVCSTQMERKKAGMKCVIFAGLPGGAGAARLVGGRRLCHCRPTRAMKMPAALVWSRIFCWAITTVRRVPEAGAKTVFLPAEKDDTDTYYAARKALELGATDVVIVGGLGGARLDIRWPTCKRWCFWQKTECVRRWRIRTMR